MGPYMHIVIAGIPQGISNLNKEFKRQIMTECQRKNNIFFALGKSSPSSINIQIHRFKPQIRPPLQYFSREPRSLMQLNIDWSATNDFIRQMMMVFFAGT